VHNSVRKSFAESSSTIRLPHRDYICDPSIRSIRRFDSGEMGELAPDIQESISKRTEGGALRGIVVERCVPPMIGHFGHGNKDPSHLWDMHVNANLVRRQSSVIELQ